MWLSWLPIKLWYRGSFTSKKKSWDLRGGVVWVFNPSSYDCDTFPSGKNPSVRNLDSFPPKRVNTNPIHHTFGGMMSPSNSPIYKYIFYFSLKRNCFEVLWSLLPLLQSLYFLHQDSNKSFKIRWVLGPSPRDAVPNQVNHVRTLWRLDWCLGLLWISRWEPTVHSGWILYKYLIHKYTSQGS